MALLLSGCNGSGASPGDTHTTTPVTSPTPTPTPTGEPSTEAGAIAGANRYLGAIQAGDYVAAWELFTDDGKVSVPEDFFVALGAACPVVAGKGVQFMGATRLVPEGVRVGVTAPAGRGPLPLYFVYFHQYLLMVYEHDEWLVSPDGGLILLVKDGLARVKTSEGCRHPA